MTLRFTVLLILLLATAPPTISAFTISSHHVNNIHRRSAVTTTATTTICKMSDQWDDETTSSTTNNEPVVTSYDDATKGMIAEAEAKELEAMGGYDDIVPGSEYNSQEKVRDAIRARTGSLGLEESQVSKEFLAEAAARAAMRSGSGGGGGSRLDLSKISDGSSKILSINYDPEDEMTQEEMESADPLGFKPFQEQMTFEFGQTTFPDLFSTFSRVVVLVIVAFTTGFLIITTDSLVREVMMAKGFIPRPEDIINAKEAGLALSQELAKKVAADSQGLSLPDIGM